VVTAGMWMDAFIRPATTESYQLVFNGPKTASEPKKMSYWWFLDFSPYIVCLDSLYNIELSTYQSGF